MQLVASDVGFAYPGRPVFVGVKLRVTDGTRLGVVGDNGAGKSTLLGVLAGRLRANSGEIRRVGSLTLVEQEMTSPPGANVGDIVQNSLTHLREVAVELDAAAHRLADLPDETAEVSALLAKAERLAAWDADRRVDEALTRLGAPRDLSRSLETLSVGERYRVRLACALVERSDLLLLDEPTNHLDDAAIEYLTAQIKAWPGGVVLVTHDRQMLDDVVTSILDLDPAMDGKPTLYGSLARGDRSGYDAYRAAKDQALRRWRERYAAETKRAAELAEVLDASYEGLSDEWRPPKGSQKHRRATRARIHVKAADRAIEKLKAEAVAVPEPPLELNFPSLPSEPLKHPVILRPAQQERRIHPRPVDVPLVALVSPVVFGRVDLAGSTAEIPPSGRLLVVGENGAGKSSLLSAIAGLLPLDSGERLERPGLRIGYLEQESGRRESTEREPGQVPAVQPDVIGPNSGFDAVATRVLELLARGELDPEHLYPVASLGLLSESDLERPLDELSVGQRRRFEIARMLVSAPHLLVLDESTNHLSIDLVDELTRALDATDAAVVVATHDRRMQAELAHWPTLKLSA